MRASLCRWHRKTLQHYSSRLVDRLVAAAETPRPTSAAAVAERPFHLKIDHPEPTFRRIVLGRFGRNFYQIEPLLTVGRLVLWKRLPARKAKKRNLGFVSKPLLTREQWVMCCCWLAGARPGGPAQPGVEGASRHAHVTREGRGGLVDTRSLDFRIQYSQYHTICINIWTERWHHIQ